MDGNATPPSPLPEGSTDYEGRSLGEGGTIDWEDISVGSSPQYVLSESSSAQSWEWVDGRSSREGSEGNKDRLRQASLGRRKGQGIEMNAWHCAV